MSVSENVLDSIELLVNNSIEKAGYDKTIQAQVISCEDATIGKYRCRYQDAIIYAYSNNSDVSYNNGAYVYILVPGNDLKKEKTILGTTQKLGINYISQAQGDQAYDLVGNNCVTSKNKFYLNSNNKNYKYVIYQDGVSSSPLKLDTTSLNQYIKQSSSLIVGGIFKTNIPAQRQYRGHYGITYNLLFNDNVSNRQVTRSYTLNEDSMIDNPYRLVYDTRQYKIFDIDGSNFIKVVSIQLFNSDFPGATGNVTGGLLNTGDIEVSSIELNGALRMSQSEIGGVAISFYTPQGTFFTSSSASDVSASYKTITAQVRIKGKLVSAAQNIPFYWGIENVGITPSSEYYNKYLGRGWRCLNNKNIVAAATGTTNPVIEWIPGKDTYVFNFNMATARNNKLKVAIVYNGNVITKEINIQNLASQYNITIESNSGTQFYYDIGHPTLTCKVNGAQLPSRYQYYWGYEDNEGVFSELSIIEKLNTDYDKAIANLNNLKTAINNGTKFANAEATNLKNYENTVKAYDFIQRVDRNKIYDVQISNITSFGTFKCSVYDGAHFLGTASITLTNTLEGEDLYSLVINNGSAVFQYNENGIAPNSKSLDVQQEIKALSFTIYDNLGQPIDSNIIAKTQNCKIRWQFPIKDTMLVQQAENNPNSGTDAEQNYRYYDNKINLIYGIAQKYDIRKQRNQIRLTVNYKGMNLTAETSFTFAKQGEPGTNGTEYIVKLVPNTKMNNPPLWPMITKIDSQNRYVTNYGINSTATESNISISSGNQLFNAQLWHNGTLVWEGATASTPAKDGQTKPDLVYWEVLKNKYNSSASDASAFEVTTPSSGGIKYTGDNLKNHLNIPLANIIKCSITIQGKTYYGTIPIITAWVKDNSYRVNLKDYTGFRYVIYTSDGILPQYDNSHPFEFICKEKINNVWENVSLVPGGYSIDYSISSVGSYLTTKEGLIVDLNGKILEILNSSAYRSGLQKNQWQARPISRYDGVCVNVAICCLYRQHGIVVGRINVPIHYLLNKYGMSHINEWDGNSVQVDNEGGFILSPQIGAGSKNNSNQFTGVLMGQVRNAGKTNADIGLLGYSKGDRTFFLNSANGSALFGKANSGQIVIDPTKIGALLYSGNFWKSYTEDGLPNNYNYRTKETYKTSGNGNGKGLLIDFTKPEIYFGTGNFYVTEDGYIHAANGGDIGGWVIGQKNLHSNVAYAQGRITLNAGDYDEETNKVIGPGKIYSHSHNRLDSTEVGFYLSYDGLSLGSKVKITNEGKMYLGSGATNENSKLQHWIVDGDSKRSFIAYGAGKNPAWAGATDEKVTDIAKVYLGTDGLSIGKRFSVDNKGSLTSYEGIIGGWHINKKSLTGGETINNERVDHIVLNKEGSIKGGHNDAKNGQYTWSITKNGVATFNSLTAKNSGNIAGWTISSNSLSGGSMTLNSDGSIHGDGWWIYADGKTSGISGVLPITGQSSIDISGAITSNGGRIGSSGGFLGAGGYGDNGKTAPLSWDTGGVTLRGNTSITDGVNISGDVTISGGVNIGNLQINKKGQIYDTQQGASGWGTVIDKTLIKTESFSGKTFIANSKTGLSGTAHFSDGGSLTFEGGILVGKTTVSDGGLNSWT